MSPLTLAPALCFLGMASGRGVSFAIDRHAGRIPLLFLAIELALAASLLAAIRPPA